jgi:hypothetical protein
MSGVGKFKTVCPAGSELYLGTCYNPCPAAYPTVSAGLNCITNCPSDYTTFPLTCTKGADLYRKESYSRAFQTQVSHRLGLGLGA